MTMACGAQDENTITFVGHAMALYLDDDYLNEKAKDCTERVRLYAYSVSRYGNSPYIYPARTRTPRTVAFPHA